MSHPLYPPDTAVFLLSKKEFYHFRNAAYATIRTFVMKFHDMDLLATRNAGNRVFYKVK